jgi:hypothetical protein
MADDRDAEFGQIPGAVSEVKENHFEVYGDMPSRQALFRAIMKARTQFAPVINDTQGMMGNRTYKYADLNTLVAATLPALDANEVSVTQHMFGPVQLSTQDGQAVEVHRVLTIVAGHGAEIWSSIDYKRAGDIKAWGGQTTYIRRYAYRAILQLDGSDDADNDATVGNQGARANTRPTPPAQQEIGRTHREPPQKQWQRAQEQPKAAPENKAQAKEPELAEERPKAALPPPEPEAPSDVFPHRATTESRTAIPQASEPPPKAPSQPPPAAFDRRTGLNRLRTLFAALGLNQQMARARVHKLCGKSSAVEMSDAEIGSVLAALEEEVSANNGAGLHS